MGICASKPKTKEIEIENAPETPFLQDKSMKNVEKANRIESESEYSQRSQDLRTDEEKVFSQQSSVLETIEKVTDRDTEENADDASIISDSKSNHLLTLQDLEGRL